MNDGDQASSSALNSEIGSRSLLDEETPLLQRTLSYSCVGHEPQSLVAIYGNASP